VNAILATSCFPNCHPAGQQIGGFQASGDLALAAAIVCVLILVVMKVRGK
jgi:flagellar biogenesis protein FliO